MRRVPASSRGLGVESPANGEMKVVGLFSAGLYLRGGGRLFAIGGPAIPRGPLHVVVSGDWAYGNLSAIRKGSMAQWNGRTIAMTDHVIDLTDAPIWNPALPTAAPVGTLWDTLAGRLATAAAVPSDLRDVWDSVTGSASCRDTAGLGEILGGRGGGLTPTGDDVLTGWMIVESMLHPGDDDIVERVQIADMVRTTHLSRAFLHWAAQGQSIEPVHELINVVASGRASELDGAVAAVERIGGSSGGALLAGMALAIGAHPKT